MNEVVRADALDEATLSRVEDVLREASGLTLTASVRRSLSTALVRAAEARKLAPPVFLKALLARDPVVVETFIEYAVIGETYFFRHPEHLRELTRVIAAHGEPVHIWSAGCATGEEPYSITMALLAAGVPVENIHVLATDISARSLSRARVGTYSPWSVRRVEPAMEKRFLTAHPGGMSVCTQARQPVEFRRHNLVSDLAPVSNQDAVFCRNVLIYFPPELVRQVLTKLVGALAPGALLFLSPAEVPLANGLGLEVLDVEGTPVLRRPVTPLGSVKEAPTPIKPLARWKQEPFGTRLAASLPLAPLTRSPLVRNPPAAPVPPAQEAPSPEDDAMRQALVAAREGKYDVVETLAREAARKLVPEAYLLLAMVAETRGDLNGAVDCVRKALYLEPQLALGHATLVTLYTRLERREDAERARQNALRALDGLDDEHPLRGVETMTAGGLRQALSARGRAGWQGAP
ncbi:CheR family methyltransferase [Stigmatella aurantiaca]|uniref:CheR4 n=1 Tax=Stigmatella aurantiaca (strain DW4/3-1) TaxID=378806 RepID=Q08UZ6_STIAD|nr:protein-glutamate O-methyltransferase CheR [Stigmatella aurantiaca]ADO71209.1 Chemotaxis protein methyltransferase CheR [Stigmatella aurantiaca DW4/3-1]EAU64323.1 CheR4 [Stigmatella aurantiaca DW4/3-1]